MGEKLIAFRDSEDEIGLLDEFCPHRRASLYWGRNEECGLRCVYHAGSSTSRALASNAERAGRDQVRPPSPHAGVSGAGVGQFDLGVPGARRDDARLAEFEWALVPESHRFVSKRLQETNYLQALEGGIDSSHVSFLHSALRTETHVSTTLGLRSEYMWRDRAPVFTVRLTEYGLLIGPGATRRRTATTGG